MYKEQPISQNPTNSRSIAVSLFDFIDLHPSAVKNLQTNSTSNKIFVSRQNYSEVYCYSENANNVHEININQLIRFDACEHLLDIQGILVMIKPFQLLVNKGGNWEIYPFTTQLISIQYQPEHNKLYTFHQKQCLLWDINEEDGVRMRYIQLQQAPYHITNEGNIQGHGKKIKPHLNKVSFTAFQISNNGKYLFVGADNGFMYVFQTKFMTIIMSIQRHQAPILAIKSVDNKIVFFSGSDSKISSLKLNQKTDQWTLSLEARGQSHDITSLSITNDNKYLISGGLTTDLCFYSLTQSFEFEQDINQNINTVQPSQKNVNWSHKIGYSSEELVESLGKYLIVNLISQFQIWKYESTIENKSINCVVKYQLPFHKAIKQIKVKYWDRKKEQILIVIVTQDETTTWIFKQSQGLMRHSTITNSYNLLQFIEDMPNSILTLRDGNILEKLDYKTGRIIQLIQTSVQYPTSLQVYQVTEHASYYVLVASKYSKEIEVFQYSQRKKLRGCQLVHKITPQSDFELVDFYGINHLLIKYFDIPQLRSISLKQNYNQQIITELPFQKIRYGGWIYKEICPETQRTKKFWYGIGEGKIVLVSNMNVLSLKKKKIRVKQFPRIGSAILNKQIQEPEWDIGVVPLNFKQFIKSNVMNPVIVKKIQ